MMYPTIVSRVFFALLVSSSIAGAQAGGIGGPPQGARGPGGMGPMQQERKVVEQFDTDGDKRLNRAERKAAREFLESQPGGGRVGGGAGGGRVGRGPGGARDMGAGGVAGAMGPGARGGGRGGAVQPASPGVTVRQSDVKSFSTPFYDAGTLRTIFLTFEGDDWEQEMAVFNNTDVEVPATMVVDGVTYNEVGVHFRGASSFGGVPAGSKRSLNVSLDFVNDSQTVRGYRTLNLLNSHEDPTFMRTVLYQQIAREYIPAPRANFVRVVINGENWGVYSSAEQFNKDFVKENFGTTEGARWKVPGSPQGRGGLEYLGDAVAPYKQIYEIKSKDTPKAWTDLIAFTKILNETPVEKLEAALAPVLDVEGALKFLALEISLVNGDGYWVRSSDYSIYQDTKGRFHIIPHDANETFSAGGGPGGRGGRAGDAGRGGPPPGGVVGGGRAGRGLPPGGVGGQQQGGGRMGGGPGGGGVTLDPLVGINDPSKPLLSRLLAVPSLRAKYVGYVRDIATRWLDWNTLQPIVSRYQNLISEQVQLDTRKLDSFEAFVAGINGAPEAGGRVSLKTFADQRRAFLLGHEALKK